MAVPVLGLIRCNCDRCDGVSERKSSSHECKPVQCFLCAVPRCSVCGRSCAATRRVAKQPCGSHCAPVCVARDAHQPQALASALQAASKFHPKTRPGDTKDASQRAGRTSTLLHKTKPNASAAQSLAFGCSKSPLEISAQLLTASSAPFIEVDQPWKLRLARNAPVGTN